MPLPFAGDGSDTVDARISGVGFTAL